MPYQRRSQLPKAVKDNLPVHAQHIFMDAFNAAMKAGQDEQAAVRIAWAAVEKSYRLDEETGRWMHLHQRTQASLFCFESDEPGMEPTGEPRKFWKELIHVGTWKHPQIPEADFSVTLDRMKGWVKNFTAGVLENVPIPLRHTDEPDRNTGFVEKLEIRGKSLWGLLSFELSEIADLIGKTIKGVSVSIWPDYQDSKTGENCGEVLAHVALTNMPHIQGLEGFIEAESPYGDIISLEKKGVEDTTNKGGENNVKLEIVKELLTAMEAEGANPEEVFSVFCEQQGLITKPAEGTEEPTSQITAEAKTAEAVEFEALPASVKAKLVEFEAMKQKVADAEDSVFVDAHPDKISAACKPLALEILKQGRKTAVEFEAKPGEVVKDIRGLFEAFIEASPKCLDFEDHATPNQEKPAVEDGLTKEKAVAEADRLITAYIPK